MYPATVNTVSTTITGNIGAAETLIYVLDESRIPEAPNILVLGEQSANAETVLLTSKLGNKLTVTRGFQAHSKPWEAGTTISRNFTAYDHDTFSDNINILENGNNINSNDIKATNKNIEPLKTKLDGIDENANNYIHPATHKASMITGLSSVAVSGSYSDLENLPTILDNTDDILEIKENVKQIKENISNISSGSGIFGFDVSFKRETFDKWTVIDSPPFYDSVSSAIQVDDCIYLFGVSVSPFNSFYKYSLKTNKWIKLSDSIDDLRYSKAAFYNGDIYFFGSYSGACTQTRKYNIENDKWTTLADNTANARMALVHEHEGIFYIIGGGLTPFTQTRKYNPVTNIWTNLAPCNVETTNACSVLYKNEIYVMGSNTSPYTQSRKYTIESNKWTAINAFQNSAQSASAILFDDEIFLAGGDNSSNANKLRSLKPSISIYWTNLSDSPNNIQTSKMISYENDIYFFGSGSYPSIQLKKYKKDYSLWEILSSSPVDLKTASIFLYNNEFYVLADGNNFFKFIPYAVKFKNQILAEVKKGQKIFYKSGNKNAILKLNDKILTDGETIALEDGFIQTDLLIDEDNYIRGWVK